MQSPVTCRSETCRQVQKMTKWTIWTHSHASGLIYITRKLVREWLTGEQVGKGESGEWKGLGLLQGRWEKLDLK